MGPRNVLILLGLILSVKLPAQQNGDVCLSDLINFYKQFKEIKASVDPICTRMVSQLDYRGNEMKDMEMKVDIMSYGDKVFYTSGEYDLYKDESDYLFVMHDKKTVFWTNGFSGNDLRTQTDVSKIYDNLFNNAKVTNCEAEADTGGNDIRTISIETGKEAQAQYGVSKITFKINFTKNEVLESNYTYTAASYLKTRIVTSYELVCGTDAFKSTAFQKVFARNNTLLPQLTGYEVIDNRQPK